MKFKSFLIKIIICLSQLFWGIPGIPIAYFLIKKLQEMTLVDSERDIIGFILFLFFWIATCFPLIKAWIFLIKKLKIDQLNEFQELKPYFGIKFD